MERDGKTVTRDAVFGNVGSIISFQVGLDDGEDLARQLSTYEDQVTSTDLTSPPKYRAYARLLIDGMPSRPFTMKTLPPGNICFSLGRSMVEQRLAERQWAYAIGEPTRTFPALQQFIGGYASSAMQAIIASH